VAQTLVLYPPTGSTAMEREMSIPPMLHTGAWSTLLYYAFSVFVGRVSTILSLVKISIQYLRAVGWLEEGYSIHKSNTPCYQGVLLTRGHLAGPGSSGKWPLKWCGCESDFFNPCNIDLAKTYARETIPQRCIPRYA